MFSFVFSCMKKRPQKLTAPQLFSTEFDAFESCALAPQKQPRQLWVPSSGLWARQPCRKMHWFRMRFNNAIVTEHHKILIEVWTLEHFWGSFFDDIYSWNSFFSLCIDVSEWLSYKKTNIDFLQCWSKFWVRYSHWTVEIIVVPPYWFIFPTLY